MANRDGAQEVVVIFDEAGSKIDREMRIGQFNALLGQKATLESQAGNTVKAAYAQVGAGLAVRAVVFFLFKVSERGYVDPAFNLPLDYMADNAGLGPDLGNGQVRMACRSQCPVPWHGINTWEPAGEGKSHTAMQVQKAVWRNRLQLKTLPATRRRSSAAVRPAVAAQQRPAERRVTLDLSAQLDQVVNGTLGVARVQSMDRQLTAALGDGGRSGGGQYTPQQREQIGHVADRFRDELQRQQQSYLEQIKSCREEIQQLKAALRHEKERNRRLQQLLRGDV